ncbi:MAG: HAD family hydrolase [Vicinamibacterales bacterium]
MTRLVAIDVDGTLLDGHGRVPAANLEALHAAAARGIHLAVVTGRSLPFVLPAVRELPAPLVLVVYNGAVARIRDGETIVRRTIDGAVARRVLAHTRGWRDATTVQFDRHDAGQTLFDRLSWEHPNRRGYYAKVRQHVSRVADLEAAVDGDAPVQVAFNGPTAAMRRLQADLAVLPDLAALSVSATHYPSRDFSLVDINAAGATKGRTLAEVAAHLGVDRGEVFAIGDNHNDVDMLQWAGTGVVMGNAEPELLALGLPVAPRNDEAGLAEALWRHVLSG